MISFCSRGATRAQARAQAERLTPPSPSPSELSNPRVLTARKGKTFYLIQLAFWLHMIPVTLIEPWRGDFVSMIVHHFITSGLIISSYSMNCLKIGVAVLAEQDFADIFLPLAKMCKYANIPTIGDGVFVLFVLAWIPTRHGLFFYIYKVIWDSGDYIPAASAKWDPANDTYRESFSFFFFFGKRWKRSVARKEKDSETNRSETSDHRKSRRSSSTSSWSCSGSSSAFFSFGYAPSFAPCGKQLWARRASRTRDRTPRPRIQRRIDLIFLNSYV